jgi:hypothetical protein
VRIRELPVTSPYIKKYREFNAEFEASKIAREQEESKQGEEKDEELKDEPSPSS